MKFFNRQPLSRPATVRAFTMVEMLVAIGLGLLVLSVIAVLFVNATRSFACIGNYQNLDAKSMMALDMLGREIRGASAVTAFSTNSSTPYFTLVNGATTTTITYYPATGDLVMNKNGVITTNLTGCDRWSFALFNRAPNTNSFSTNIAFYATSKLSEAKLIQMSWKCSRQVMGTKLNTESVQTAQIVLRNKVE